MSFSASDSAFEGFRLTRRAPLAIALWALVYFVGSMIMFAAMGGALGDLMQAAEAMEAASSGGDPDIAVMGDFFAAYGRFAAAAFPIGIILNVVMSAAVSRAVLRPSEKAFGYLRLGGDELRVFVVNLVLLLVFIGVGIVGGIVIGVAAGVLGQTNEGAAAGVAILLMLVLVCAIIWIAVRLGLAVPMTVAERRIRIFDSWGVTKGRFWSLLGMGILAFILALVVQILLSLVGVPLAMAIGGGMGAFEQIASLPENDIQSLLRTMAPLFIGYLAFGAILQALQYAILMAPWASAYQQLSGRE
ncbi:hypothetical protein Q0812_09715 [Brevundimonas sp. 2R-24]|uniref:Glycerophosphoryl diester phosphodiesterase membrane domain-containing protein n=1 Tax=Peiella sedimenti TaxID=3061083 RepID=A0ABT8SPX2_9CAUL|nr:hypothetical protein [Caulobacteraceae bacterium XZ-24]